MRKEWAGASDKTFRTAKKSALNTRLAKWLTRIATDHYQPEKHYMRGPGPATLQRRAREPQKPET